MSAQLIKKEDDNYAVLENVIVKGDLGTMSSEDRIKYYSNVCNTLGLNPLTRPFEYIKLNGKTTLYAKKDCTEQLRNINNVSIQITSREVVNDVYIVTAKATNNHGRVDESLGAVSVKGLSGEALANAFMKAETKAKRRVTLSINGLGFLDESEVDSIPNAVVFDEKTINSVPNPKIVERLESANSSSSHAKELSDLIQKCSDPKKTTQHILSKCGVDRLSLLSKEQHEKYIASLKKQLSEKE